MWGRWRRWRRWKKEERERERMLKWIAKGKGKDS